MNIYEHTTSLTTASGSISTVTLNIRGAILRYLLVRAGTSSTVFKTNLIDGDSITRLNYGFHTGELVDDKIAIPVVGNYTIQIQNASPDDTFRVILSCEE